MQLVYWNTFRCVQLIEEKCKVFSQTQHTFSFSGTGYMFLID